MEAADYFTTGDHINLTAGRIHSLDRGQNLLLEFIGNMHLAQLQINKNQLLVLDNIISFLGQEGATDPRDMILGTDDSLAGDKFYQVFEL